MIAYLRRQSFYPGFLGLFVNPFFFARRDLARNMRTCAASLEGELLDVGCGSKPYRELCTGVSKYIGMDIENPGHDHSKEDIDVFYDGRIFPFPANHFDSVLTNQVLEHVFNPSEFLSEIHRVMKPGGKLLLTVPFMWDEHEQPNDFGRYTSFGLRALLERHGFEIIVQIKSCTGFAALVQLWNLNIYKKFYSRNQRANVMLTFLLLSPFNVIGAILSLWKSSNKDMYLDNVVLAQKKL